MLIDLPKAEKGLFDKLTVSCMDIGFAKQCAEHLLKKGWHSHQWQRRGSVYFQQSVYTTSLIVSYTRPFTKTRGLPDIPADWLDFSPDEERLHTALRNRRNTVYAHSDGSSYSFRPWKTEDFATIIEQVPSHLITKAEAELFVSMSARLLKSLIAQREAILSIWP
ncbi:hypothetical protein [Mesorhizobium sp. GbtcB19]|uniref:hypothetical protein n=1 Tax=Mesorhizobium sp. GbtcB19 TaxID=2824764 RepID=UPI001C30C4A4|nr:hypothetical protein [Mesorhizobium sp. GbtcB19]